jgi:hypothetical protein
MIHASLQVSGGPLASMGRRRDFGLVTRATRRQNPLMKFLPLVISVFFTAQALASTITVVPIYEPLSLHGTDGDEAISDIGEALQASVMARPMALTGAFPEVLVDSIKSAHQIPTNNPNYKVTEVNLLVLCNIGISGKMTEEGLQVNLDITQLAIPQDVDLTSRQVLKLVLIAVRKTLEEYQRPQPHPLAVSVVIDGAVEAKASLADLGVKFTLGEPVPSN